MPELGRLRRPVAVSPATRASLPRSGPVAAFRRLEVLLMVNEVVAPELRLALLPLVDGDIGLMCRV